MPDHFWHGLIGLMAFAAMLTYRVWFPRQPYINRKARALFWLGHLGALAGALVILHACWSTP